MATSSEIVEGLTILAKYHPRGMEGHLVEAEHDVIYTNLEKPRSVSAEDQHRLDELGWHFSKEFGQWARFV